MGQGRSVSRHLDDERRAHDQYGQYGVKNPVFDEAHSFANKLLRRHHQPHLLEARSSEIIEVYSYFQLSRNIVFVA